MRQVWLAVVLGGYFAAACVAQERTRVSFDVVSIKQGQADTGVVVQTDRGFVRTAYHPFRYTPGHVTCSLPLISFLLEAYSVKLWQLAGPPWLYDGVYDLTATMPADTSREQARLMLQTMLRERFGLQIHREDREISIYALAVGKAGSKLVEVPVPDARKIVAKTGELTASNLSTQGFADWLTGSSDRPVIDMTGLPGVYSFEILWMPEYADPTDVKSVDLGLFAAVQTQLGLRLTPTRGTYSVVVVDNVRRDPGEN